MSENSGQSLAGAHLRHRFRPALSVTERCLSPEFCFSSSSKVRRGMEGCDLVVPDQTHPGTQGPVVNTISLGFPVPSMPKSRDTGQHQGGVSWSQSPVTEENTHAARYTASAACSLPLCCFACKCIITNIPNPATGLSALVTGV